MGEGEVVLGRQATGMAGDTVHSSSALSALELVQFHILNSPPSSPPSLHRPPPHAPPRTCLAFSADVSFSAVST